MIYTIVKIFLTAGLIVLISEISKRSNAWGGLIAALPITSFLVILWMHFEGASDEKVAKHISYTLLYVLPTLPAFLIFPWIIERFGFWVAFFASLALIALCMIGFNAILRRYGMGIL